MATPRNRRLTRALALVATGGLAVLTLSGCLSLTANLTVDSDAKASGDLAIGLEKQAAGMLGMTDLSTFEQGLQSDELTGDAGGLFDSGQCTASETDTQFVYTCTFTDTAFATPDDGPWTITKDGDVITFNLVNEGSGASDDPAADMLGGSMGDFIVNVTFPGPIQSVSGDGVTKNSDTSATVKVAMADAANVTITSAASSGGGIGTILLVVGLVLLAVIVIGIVIALVMRGRKSSPAPAIGAPAAGAAIVTGAVVSETASGETTVVETVAMEAVPTDIPAVEATAVDETVVVETVTDEVVVDDTGVTETITDEVVVESPEDDRPTQ